MSQVFINDVLVEVGQGADEIISLRRQLAELKANSQAVLQAQSGAWQREVSESQVREAKLREVLQKVADTGLHYAGRLPGYAQCALYEIPTDDTALREMIAKAGEVMRERCMRVPDLLLDYQVDAISALPGVKLEDLQG